MKLKICLPLLFVLSFTCNLKAQTPITTNGQFTVNNEIFGVGIHTLQGIRPTPKQIAMVTSNRNSIFTTANYSSTTCSGINRSFETDKYRFSRNRGNSMQVFTILKMVFSPQRCAQLGNNYFDVSVSVFPNNNTINETSYHFYPITGITQEEIAQLDRLIRTTTTFTFPKIAGICNNVSSMTLGGIRFNFNELHTNPRFNGIGDFE